MAPLDLARKASASRLSDQIPVYPFDGKALAYGKDDRPAGKPTQYVVRALDNTDPKAYALRCPLATLRVSPSLPRGCARVQASHLKR